MWLLYFRYSDMYTLYNEWAMRFFIFSFDICIDIAGLNAHELCSLQQDEEAFLSIKAFTTLTSLYLDATCNGVNWSTLLLVLTSAPASTSAFGKTAFVSNFAARCKGVRLCPLVLCPMSYVLLVGKLGSKVTKSLSCSNVCGNFSCEGTWKF